MQTNPINCFKSMLFYTCTRVKSCSLQKDESSFPLSLPLIKHGESLSELRRISFMKARGINKNLGLQMEAKYDLRRKIGQGSFGSVFLAVEKRTRKTVVVKQVRSAEEETTSTREREALDVQREVQLLSQLAHPNIVEYVESFAGQANG